jgi:uncharacterized protein YcnI
MRMTLSLGLLLATSIVMTVSAHIIVSPIQSKSGAIQKYELRVHNEAKVAATSLDLDIPDGVTVTDIGQPAAGTYTAKRSGERIVSISWQVEVPPNKYVALPFTAKNPDSATELRWSVREHLADGTIVEWSDKPGAKEKGSVTKLTSGL